MTEQEYKEYLKNLRKKKTGEIFGNSSSTHAWILIANLIDHAQKSVKIFAQKLGHDIYAQHEVINATRQALKRGITFEVILQDDKPDEQSALFVEILREHNVPIILGKCNRLTKNFLVADRKEFRLENDKRGRRAVASFIREEDASVLEDLFREIKVS